MIRLLNALFLSVVLVLTSITFAHARGGYQGTGTDMVICTGTGLIVLSIGEDGEPIEKMVVCPDAASIFAGEFVAPKMPVLSLTIMAVLEYLFASSELSNQILSPSARGPPLGVWKSSLTSNTI